MTAEVRAGSSIWRLAWVHRRLVLLSWDLWMSVVLGGLVYWFVQPSASVLFDVAAVEVGVASALVGVILAGFAVITAFMDRNYVAVLAATGRGVTPDVFRFRFTATIAVVGILVNVALIVVRNATWLESHLSVALAVSIGLFSYALFATLNLVASVGGHMYNRSLQLEVEKRRESTGEGQAGAKRG